MSDNSDVFHSDSKQGGTVSRNRMEHSSIQGQRKVASANLEDQLQRFQSKEELKSELKPLSTSFSSPVIPQVMDGQDQFENNYKVINSSPGSTSSNDGPNKSASRSRSEMHDAEEVNPLDKITEGRKKKKKRPAPQIIQEIPSKETAEPDGESLNNNVKFTIEGVESASDLSVSPSIQSGMRIPFEPGTPQSATSQASLSTKSSFTPNALFPISKSETEIGNSPEYPEVEGQTNAETPRTESSILLRPSSYAPSISVQSESDQMLSKRRSNLNKSGKSSKKRSAWYNTFNPTYKSRSDEFKKLFSHIDERLIVEYSCALQKDILVQGRMYATKTHICFYAKIFQWETSVAISWSDVVNITKEKTALVIPNAIQINTEKEKHFFTSFTARDKTFPMLVKLWKSANSNTNKNQSASDLWGWIHEAYGEELGLTSDDDPDYVRPSSLTATDFQIDGSENSSSGSYNKSKSYNKPNIQDNEQITEPIQDNNIADDVADNADNNSELQLSDANSYNSINNHKKKHKKQKKDKEEKMVALGEPYGGKKKKKDKNKREKSQEDGEELDNSVGAKNEVEEEDEVTDDLEEEEDKRRIKSRKKRGYSGDIPANNRMSTKNAEAWYEKWKSSLDDGCKEMLCEDFNIDVDTLFTLYFTKSKFFIDFHNTRKTYDIVQSDWQAKGSGDKYREVSMTLSLTHPMGPKSSRLTEKQTLLADYSSPGEIYAVNVDTLNNGIPYADSFHVVLKFCLSRVSPTQSRMTVVAAIKYNKSVWGLVKNFIEKNTWSGLEEFYQELARSLHNESDGLGSNENGIIDKPSASEATSRKLTAKSVKANGNKRTNSASKDIGTSREAGQVGSGSDLSPGIWGSNPLSRLLGGSNSNDTIFKLIVVFLITLLCANTFLLYKMWFIESRIAKETRTLNPFETLKYLDPQFFMKHSSGEKPLKRTTEDWLILLQKQEMIHQMELEKWNEMIGMASELLRKTEQSLSNLQKNIHPMTLQKLRGIMYLQNEDEMFQKMHQEQRNPDSSTNQDEL